jgi:uncharacterized membrane protein
MNPPYPRRRNPFFVFIKATLSGGILVMLPIVLVFIIAARAFEILRKLSAPLAERLPDVLFLGLDGSKLLTLFLAVLICFLTGLLVRSKGVRSRVSKLEDFLTLYVPGYSMLKSVAADSLGQVLDGRLVPVLIEDDGAYNIGFLVEENGPWSTVFLLEAPRHDSGEVKIIASAHVKKIDMPAHLVIRSIKNYGKGIIEWLPKEVPGPPAGQAGSKLQVQG